MLKMGSGRLAKCGHQELVIIHAGREKQRHNDGVLMGLVSIHRMAASLDQTTKGRFNWNRLNSPCRVVSLIAYIIFLSILSLGPALVNGTRSAKCR